MDNTQRHLTDPKAATPGLAGDLRRLKSDGGASAAELREFLTQLKGRSPEEVMGAVAQSNLIRSICIAMVGCVVLMAVFTIIPYLMRENSVAAAPDSPPVVSASETIPKPTDANPNPNSTTKPESTKITDPQKAIEKMGIGGTADPDANAETIDSRLDNLLDGID